MIYLENLNLSDTNRLEAWFTPCGTELTYNDMRRIYRTFDITQMQFEQIKRAIPEQWRQWMTHRATVKQNPQKSLKYKLIRATFTEHRETEEPASIKYWKELGQNPQWEKSLKLADAWQIRLESRSFSIRFYTE